MEEDVRSSTLKDLCRKNNINKLSDFQHKIFDNEDYFYPSSKNLLFSSPTGSGKSLVAETITCVNVRCSKKKALFIQPYVASASETFFKLQRHWRNFGLSVKAHFGASSLSSHDEYHAVICTIEKGAALVNRLIKENMLEEFCTIIIDEVHMFFDNDRGNVLEDLLIKLKYIRSNEKYAPQIIAMSATIEDPSPLISLMDTSFEDFSQCRNVALNQFYSANSQYYSNQNGILTKTEKKVLFNFKDDSNGLLNLVMERVVNWDSVLIFCRTKALVEKTAKLIAACVRKCASKKHNVFEKLTVNVSRCPSLYSTETLGSLLKLGVAFHHAGVSSDKRSKIEELYIKKQISVIVCTTTLSTGVNLPASRVLILLSDGYGKSLSYVTYHQMIGRTGREGFGEGDSYLISQDFTQLEAAFNSLTKHKFTQKDRDYTQLVLDSIAIGLVDTLSKAEQILKYIQHKSHQSLSDSLAYLKSTQLIGSDESFDDSKLATTQLGSAISSTFLAPEDGLTLYRDLDKALGCLDLRSDIQMLYLITPLPSRLGFRNLDLTKLLRWHDRLLTSTEKEAARKLGVSTNSCVKLSFAPKYDPVHARFYLTFILRELLNQTSEDEILSEFGFEESQLECLRVQTIVYCRVVGSITDQLGWSYLRDVMNAFSQKVELVINKDLSDLLRLPGIDGIRALTFASRGVENIRQLASAEASIIERILRLAVPFIEGQKRGDENEWLKGQVSDCKTAVDQLLVQAQKFYKLGKEELSLSRSSIGDSSLNLTRRSLCTSLYSQENSCIEKVLTNASFVVIEFGEDSIGIVNDSEVSVFIKVKEECRKCQSNVTEELERLFSSDVDKYTTNLSRLFYVSKLYFDQVSFISENPGEYLNRWHCVLSMMRVRNKKIDSDPLKLDVYFDEVLKKFGSLDSRESRLQMITRFVNFVLHGGHLSDNVKDLTRIWLESVRTCIYMSYCGFPLDIFHFDQFRRNLLQRMSHEEETVWKLAKEKFNVYKVSETRKILTSLGISVISSTGKVPGTLEELRQSSGLVVEHIIKAREVQTAYTQLEKIVESCDIDSGRIYSYYNTLSHSTGRISIEEPPIQMLTKRDVLDGRSARSIVKARPGYLLVAADYSQLELRMILALSGDKLLQRLIKDNIDPFEYLSDQFLSQGITVDRGTSKMAFYSFVYGIGASSLASKLGIDMDTSQKVLDTFVNTFKDIGEWLNKVTTTAMERNYVANIWGLGISLSGMKKNEARRRIPNFIIQSSVTYAFRVALNNVFKAIPASIGGVILQMHDELICEIKEFEVSYCVSVVSKLMETTVLGITFPVSVKIGYSWDQLEPFVH